MQHGRQSEENYEDIALNPPQKKAVSHCQGPLLTVAGAGSGKTRVLTTRIAHLISFHGVKPSAILAVTFTNKACDEMKDRLERYLGLKARALWVATFHSAALRILRRHSHAIGYDNSFTVYDSDDSKRVIKRVLKELNIDYRRYSPQMYLTEIEKAKSSMILPEKFAKIRGASSQQRSAEVYLEYQKQLRSASGMDFGDLLLNCVILFEQNPELLKRYQHQLEFILVDEFQDTNEVQYKLVLQLSGEHRNVFVVGDDDQSIYAFRGATPKNLLRFEKDFPGVKVIKLEQNYRSTGNILECANTLISRNTDRKKKKLWTDSGEGDPVFVFCGYDEEDEAGFVCRMIEQKKQEGFAYKDMAVFYRTNAQSRSFEEELMLRQIPYRIFGGLKFYDRKEIKDIVAYLRVIANENDNQACYRIINVPSRGVGAATRKRLRDYAVSEGVSIYEAARVFSDKLKAVRNFTSVVERIKEKLDKLSLSELVEQILRETGYEALLKKDKTEESLSRLENLKELRAIAASMERIDLSTRETLIRFLDRVSLTTSGELPSGKVELNEKKEEEKDRDYVSLMTLHLAKGLEFPVVYLSGFEEGLLPHSRSILADEIEEERRLAYVGITRAMKTLYITRAERRGMFSSGETWRSVSQFAFDLPRERIQDLRGGFFTQNIWGDDSFELDGEYREYQRKGRMFSDGDNGGANLKGKKSGNRDFKTGSLVIADEME